VVWCPSYLLWLPTEGQTSAQYWEVVLIQGALSVDVIAKYLEL